MIQINCTQCQEVLQIDDAFAGGVCRCKFCGAIQTVPKRLKGANGDGNEIAEASYGGAGGTTTYQKRTATDAPSGTGLDDLAGIVASSGLSSGRLQKKQPAQSTSPPAARQTGGRATPAKPAGNKTGLIIGAAGAVIVLLLGVIIAMALRDKTTPPAPDPTKPTVGVIPPGPGVPEAIPDNKLSFPNVPNNPKPTEARNPSVAKPPKIVNRGPSFLGQPITEPSVVYVIDHGQSSGTEGRLDSVKRALGASLRSLGPQKKFAVMFWQVKGESGGAWPAKGLRDATPQHIADAMAEVDKIYANGQTQPPTDLDQAFKSGAAAIVYLPIKSFAPDDLAEPVMAARGSSTAKVYGFTIELKDNENDIAKQLSKLAADTKGAYKDVSMQDLRDAGE